MNNPLSFCHTQGKYRENLYTCLNMLEDKTVKIKPANIGTDTNNKNQRVSVNITLTKTKYT